MSNSENSRRRFIKIVATGALGIAMNSRASSAPRPCVVDISFEGMMVFHELDDEYEVGLVDRRGHAFTIYTEPLLDSPIFRHPPMRPSPTSPPIIWRFEVKKGSAVRRSLSKIKKGHKKQRFDDIKEGQNDFDWIIDFES